MYIQRNEGHGEKRNYPLNPFGYFCFVLSCTETQRKTHWHTLLNSWSASTQSAYYYCLNSTLAGDKSITQHYCHIQCITYTVYHTVIYFVHHIVSTTAYHGYTHTHKPPLLKVRMLARKHRSCMNGEFVSRCPDCMQLCSLTAKIFSWRLWNTSWRWRKRWKWPRPFVIQICVSTTHCNE